MYHGIDINICIASAITAYSRMYMSYFKNNSDFNLYYSDTDSVVIDKKLPAHIVGKDLGHFKLEHTIAKAVFLAPKVYAFETIEGKEIIKVKGLTEESQKQLTFKDVYDLLTKDNKLELFHEKWYKISLTVKFQHSILFIHLRLHLINVI